MIVRIWRTGLDLSREDEYRAFEETQSLPMFRQQAGFRGVLFLRQDGSAAALTYWESPEAVARLGESDTYRATVDRLEQTRLLRGSQTVEVFQVTAGHLEHMTIDDKLSD
jgi:heme-degrading monooxygenase HmoA